jgi:hypothetical protein
MFKIGLAFLFPFLGVGPKEAEAPRQELFVSLFVSVEGRPLIGHLFKMFN